MPQPIDVQTEMGRLATAERVQQVTDRISLVAQQRVAANEQQERLSVETEVQQTHAKSDEVDTETKRRNPYLRKVKRRDASGDEQEDERPEKPSPPVAFEEHKLDVSI